MTPDTSPSAPEATPATPEAPPATHEAPQVTPGAPPATHEAPQVTPGASPVTPEAPQVTPEDHVAAAGTPVPQDVARPRRRRGRTTLIVACAALLGVLAGAGTGYGIQARRSPTPPSALGQPGMNRPAYAYTGSHAIGSKDDLLTTDGDLTKQLLPVPKGMYDSTSDDAITTAPWMDTAAYARTYDDAAYEFSALLEAHYRRGAWKAWTNDSGSFYGEADLLQFRDDDSVNAETFLMDAERAVDGDSRRHPLSLAPDGMLNAMTYLMRGHGDEYPYQARGLARHGDVVIYVFLDSEHPISRSAIETLTRQQLERL